MALTNALRETLRLNSRWLIYKYRDPDRTIGAALKAGAPVTAFPFYACEEIIGNVALNEGLQELIRLIAATDGVPTLWDNGNASIGVGDSNAGENPVQTGLQALVNLHWETMDVGYPQRSNQTCEWRATFAAGHGTFAWEEFTVVNAANDAGMNLNRKVTSKGSKAAGESWTAVLQILFS